MPFTNTTAASCGLVAMHAMDMYRTQPTALTPAAPPALLAAGWTIVGYVCGTDTALPRGVKGPLAQLVGQTVYYGFVVRNAAGALTVAIRGTDGFVEWVEDGEFIPIRYTPSVPLPAGTPAMTVEQGFWGLYATLTLIDPQGAPLGGLASAVATLAGDAAPVTVIGHSLGSALATYLTLDLARGPVGPRLSACLFASPHTGDAAFVALFDQHVGDYRLFNYVLDIVPRVPAGLGYQPLPRSTVLQPAGAEAVIRMDIGCNHHVICYCAMLDYEQARPFVAQPPAGEESSAACVLGPETGSPSVAKEIVSALAGLIPA